jgi:hypothetical protein
VKINFYLLFKLCLALFSASPPYMLARSSFFFIESLIYWSLSRGETCKQKASCLGGEEVRQIYNRIIKAKKMSGEHDVNVDEASTRRNQLK